MKKFRELKEEVSTPPIGVRSLYTKMYAKHGGTASQVKDAQSKAYSEVEKKHGKEMRNSLEAYHKKNMNEEKDEREYDYEGDMAKTQLKTIIRNAETIHDMLEDDENLPEWVQSKITLAKDYIVVAANYLQSEMDESSSAYDRINARFKKLSGRSMGDAAKEHGEEAKRLQKEIDAQKAENERRKAAMKTEEVELDEGRPSQRHPLEGHEYHKKSNDALVHIAKDAHKAAEAMKGHNTNAENKYRDQANDSATVRYFRQKSGMPDWYKKKYGHMKEDIESLEEKNEPTNPELWSRAKALAKSKFDVYPSAYANGWASKWYKSKGGSWKSVNEENYEVTVMHTTKDGDKGEHTHKVMNADDSRHAKNIALQKHDKMLKSKGVEVRGMGTTTAKIVEAKENPKDYSGEKGNMWHPTGKTGTHMASGKNTYEYAEVDKEGKKTGARHYKDIQGKHMGEAKEDNMPFKPDEPKKKSVVVGKKPEGYSIARQLARQAMQKQIEKLKKPVKESEEKATEPFITSSRKAQIVKNIAKKKVKEMPDEKFQDQPVLSNTITRNN